ncbi:hypothetical protein [Rubellimicrobium aerolatum]|uniref:Uncharacterized protein n=1 Tax=Rubellimicrobium aerolatum TaxID=490979 RepID=A0ABW0SBS5_9RHOB|nr:hypothetical protein [Rubellimicrobium aerolatum]MBP1805865.1 hypothetical protein [Rubellimicrobium aerolatum]
MLDAGRDELTRSDNDIVAAELDVSGTWVRKLRNLLQAERYGERVRQGPGRPRGRQGSCEASTGPGSNVRASPSHGPGESTPLRTGTG